MSESPNLSAIHRLGGKVSHEPFAWDRLTREYGQGIVEACVERLCRANRATVSVDQVREALKEPPQTRIDPALLLEVIDTSPGIETTSLRRQLGVHKDWLAAMLRALEKDKKVKVTGKSLKRVYLWKDAPVEAEGPAPSGPVVMTVNQDVTRLEKELTAARARIQHLESVIVELMKSNKKATKPTATKARARAS
jgi:hypothetical protein